MSCLLIKAISQDNEGGFSSEYWKWVRGNTQNFIESRNMISGYRLERICVRVDSEEVLQFAFKNNV